MKTLLIIDTDQAHVDSLAAVFESADYRVLVAADGLTGLAMAHEYAPDLVVLDLVLPKLDGYSVCSELRKQSRVPILILSSVDSELYRIASFALGANDFLVKPAHIGELVARIRSLVYWHAQHAYKAVAADLKVGHLQVHLTSRQVWWDGQERRLAQKEFDLLVYLMQHPGQVVSRDALIHEVWPSETVSDVRTIDVHIRWLREKIEVDPARPHLIETVRGSGYRFTTGIGEPLLGGGDSPHLHTSLS